MVRALLAAVCATVALSGGPRLPLPEFEVNLDDAPEHRFGEVNRHFQEPLMDFVYYLHAYNPLVKLLTKELARRRGPENDELQAEIRSVASTLNVTEDEVHALQMFYELNTIMVPLVNISGFGPGMGLEDVAGLLESATPSRKHRMPLPPHVGCTGIIATDDDDGTVYHGRNLDFSFAKYLQALAYTGIFKRSGKEVFRAQTIAGYSSILTGMRKGSNGYTIEINTRFADHVGGYREALHHLFSDKRNISGWSKRKILENIDNFEDAVEAFSTTPYPASEYNIVSGVRKGVILARNPDGLAYKLSLNESDKKYIIMTNFDYPWHDIKEIFDPTTVKGIFHPRRKAAEKILDDASVLTPELIFDVLNDDGVMAKDTIFQVIMNVEKGFWNASLPGCVDCGRDGLVV